MTSMPLDRERIAAVENIIRPHVRRTPILVVAGADFRLDSISLIFKLEFLQHAGSFKARGAFANLLTREGPKAGVVAASGGNHGVAVAYAAGKLGVPAKIFVPNVASSEKVECIRRDTLLVAVGGGGLIGGIAAWYAGKIKLIGVEPEAAPTLANALHAGRPVDSPAGGIAADSLAPKRVGELMFPIAQKYVEKVILVTDREITQAQEALWSVLRAVTEPGGAAAFAALLSRRYQPAPEERVGILLCGGNIAAVNFNSRIAAPS